MRIIKPSYYKDFRCIAGECPDSCCQGWEVDADSESLDYYAALPDELEIKKRIDSVLDKDEFGNTIFTLKAKKRCPFLNDENLCDMHIAIGQEHTPYTCRTFPRFIYDFGGTREIGVSFSCPVAADMIYALNGRLEFDEELTDELPSLNDIDAGTFFKIKSLRSRAFRLAEDKSVDIKEKLIRLLSDAAELQRELDNYSEGGDSIGFFEVFKNPELINPEWEERVNGSREKCIENADYNVNIIEYFIYKYYLLSVYDNDILSKAKMAVIGVLINTYFVESAWTLHLWSKETEHSQYNMDRYKRLLKEADCLTVKSLIERINK